MDKIYHYVVLRLAIDDLRGEIINVGIVLFAEEEQPRLIVMATLNKLRALDASWDQARFGRWVANIQEIIAQQRTPQEAVQGLAMFGFCDAEAIGMFTASNQTELASEIAEVKATYVSNRAATAQHRERRSRLHTLLRERFRAMHVLGATMDDLANHMVVAHVPVPGHSELRTDFLYGNGVYSITQAIDYRISPDSVHNKLSEVCLKITAAHMAARAYGPTTQCLAVLDIPPELEDATDAQVDLLHAQNFDIFRFGDPQSMAEYLQRAAPPLPIQ
ncbi:MAG: DUF3037 domain-containing protein [Acidobacteriaceae bacterium]